MKLKRWIQSTIGLSSSEANAMIILLPSLFVIIFSEPFYRWYTRPQSPIAIQEEKFLDSLVRELHPVVDSSIPAITLFKFDPNVSSLRDFRTLGVPEAVGRRIIQYRNKGGQFRIKADLAKIYGLDSMLYQTLLPFILLPDRLARAPFAKPESLKTPIQFDLNLADTTSFKSVQGIGSVLSKRIVKYREGLGGFIEFGQLKEVYGLDSTAVKGLESFYVAQGFEPLRIKINAATETELSSHPYLSRREAKAIITYRLQHGNFAGLDDLGRIKTIDETTITKLGPYLSFE